MIRKWIFLLLAASAGGILTGDLFWKRHVLLDGRIFDREATVLALPYGVAEPEALAEFANLRWLDLRGSALTGEEFLRLSRWVPGTRILWELSFQGRSVPASAQSLRIDHLSDEDVLLLDYLRELRRVDAAGCRDYPQLLRLQQRHKDCRVEYTVALGGVECSCTDTAFAPGQCTADALRRGLTLLPKAEFVDLRATGLTHREAVAMAEELPEIRFLWNAELGGVTFPTDSREIDLSGIPMEDSREVEALLPFLPNLEKVVMCDCGIPSPRMAELNDRYPDIRFVWRVKLGPLSARTDDTWFAPITKQRLIGGHDVDELKYCTDMVCIDLGHCWITDCEWARGMQNLRYLVLADSYIHDLSPLSELKNLAYLELFVTPVRNYAPLLGCTGLEDLNLGYTKGDPTPVAAMTWLKNLWWGGISHVPAPDGRDPAALLREGLPDTRVTLYSGSSTGLGWRNLPHYYEMRDMIGMYYMTG